MAAKLEWKTNGPTRLTMGSFVLACVDADANAFWRHGLMGNRLSSDPYESLTDCMQDCESEVRRLLKEAGVTLED